MTSDAASSAPSRPWWVPVVVLAALALACGLSGYVLLGRSVDHYTLPGPTGGIPATHTYTERVALGWLGVGGAAVAGIGLVLTLLRREFSRGWWIALILIAMVVLNFALVVGGTPQPTY